MPSGLTGGWNETPKYRMVHRPETYSRVYWGGLGLGVICMKVDWINIQHITQTEKSCEDGKICPFWGCRGSGTCGLRGV